MQFYLNQNLTSEKQLSTEILENHQFIDTKLNFPLWSCPGIFSVSLITWQPQFISLNIKLSKFSKISLPCKSLFDI